MAPCSANKNSIGLKDLWRLESYLQTQNQVPRDHRIYQTSTHIMFAFITFESINRVFGKCKTRVLKSKHENEMALMFIGGGYQMDV